MQNYLQYSFNEISNISDQNLDPWIRIPIPNTDYYLPASKTQSLYVQEQLEEEDDEEEMEDPLAIT